MKYAVLIIAVCAICTFMERALPFIIFHGKDIPDGINYLGKILPPAIIATLVFYCLRNCDFTQLNSGFAQIVSCAVTVGLHLWKGNTLLSIFGGTAVCMLLTQLL